MPSLFSAIMLLPGLWGVYVVVRWVLSHWFISMADQIVLGVLATVAYFTAAMIASIRLQNSKAVTRDSKK